MASSEHVTRRKVDKTYREYRAIMILLNRLSADDRKQVDHTLAVLPTLSLEAMNAELPEIEKELRIARSEFGVTASRKQIESLIDPKRAKPGTQLFIPKYLLQKLVSKYEKILPIYSDLPPHTRIGIDILGTRIQLGAIEIFLLEGALFEDMAALWNAVLELPHSLEEEANVDPVAYKRMMALNRSTAKAAFNLLEGYLNGLALDILHTQKVNPEEKIKLTEWDPLRSRSVVLNLREKLLQYPRIAVGSPHPPLQESNCPEMAKVISFYNRIRHALIHPNPRIPEHDPEEFREGVFWNLRRSEVLELCEITTALIRRICATIEKKYGDVDVWLYDRNLEGRFPDIAFK